MVQEEIRLEEDRRREKNWKRWGPYLADRQWATVREDYSPDGDSWNYFPFEHSHVRCYRWGEDGIFGISDRECRLCFALSFWNGKDPILKERFFGLVPGQGNHGEDVKECYYYLDSSPTHSYMKALYKYPQECFPYQKLISENQKRGLLQPEYELTDTGIFDLGNYFDIYVEYAKNDPNDLFIRATIINRSKRAAPLHFLPTLWYRNTWSWGCEHEGCTAKQTMYLKEPGIVYGAHITLGEFAFHFDQAEEAVPLFTDNETNFEKLYGVPNKAPFTKEAFHEYVIHQKFASVNPHLAGSKFSPMYSVQFAPGEVKTFRFRLLTEQKREKVFDSSFDAVFDERKKESDLFFDKRIEPTLEADEKMIIRQSFAGLLWNKMFYHFVVDQWLKGDPLQPPPPPSRKNGRNKDWVHVFCRDVISPPDKWEYPWFAAWDLAFHLVPFSKIDPEYAKRQVILFLREWYMHPNGQQPAYEYEFSDVNPPVHAWAAWRVYKMTGEKGNRDVSFLESAFQKLLLNFTWWVNKKDAEGHNLFSGGFLGLDNIGVFDRSTISKEGGYLEQADGTGWMAFYCLTMLTIALELASYNPVYEDLASKFFEHFIYIADAINEFGGNGLWDEKDGFYYDLLKHDGEQTFLRTRSLVGLLPLIAVETLEEAHLKKLPGFTKRMQWFFDHRSDLDNCVTYAKFPSEKGNRLLAIPSKERLIRILGYLFDEEEFLSPYGIRSLSKQYEKEPYHIAICGQEHIVNYVPGVSNSYMFGGNSNWRGPIWFPLNFLIIEALERYDHYYGEDLKVEYPTGSGNMRTLKEAADDIAQRLINLFSLNEQGKRPCLGGVKLYEEDPHWQDLILFYEYFHAETGAGLGASHQTGWTAIVARLLQKKGIKIAQERSVLP